MTNEINVKRVWGKHFENLFNIDSVEESTRICVGWIVQEEIGILVIRKLVGKR